MKSKILFAILILLSFCQTQSYLESINNQFSPLTLDEHNEITSLIKKVSNFLNKTQKTEPSINNLKFLQKNNSEKSFMCKSCLSIYGHMYSFIMNKYSKKAIFYLLPLLCPSGINKEVCNEYLNLYGPVVYESVGNRFLNGEYICSISKICKKDHFIKLSAEKYAEDLLKDKPLNVTNPFIDIEAPTWKILHVSDLHIDDLYKEGSQTKCSETLCCRINSTSNTTTIDRAGKWGFIGKCDLPVRTLELFTNYVNKEIKPDFVLWTGDNAPHDTWTGSQKAAYNATQIFVDLISKNNNFSLPIYPTLGNHEIFPNDEYNPFDNNDKVFNRFAEIFKPWLSDEAYETFSKYGYYSQLHPNSNLRIVSTNCLLCDSINFNLIKNPTDPKDELKWLENTLRQSEQAGEVVYIISHIPIGDAFFLNECAKRHLAIIERFSHIIRGQFYGHTHNDEVKIARDYFNEEKITGVMFIAPSMTTYANLQPSFRVFDVDSNTKIPKDYLQYRLNLTNANSLNETEIPQFDIAYKASEFFNIKYLNDTQGIFKYTQEILTDPEVFNKALKAYFSDGPMYKTFASVKNMPEYLSCKFSKPIFSEYFKCVKQKPIFDSDFTYMLMNILDGSWYKKLSDLS